MDDLALRSILELEDNQVGETRRLHMVRLARERGLRFGYAVEYVRLHRDQFGTQRLGAVVNAVDAIVGRARDLEPRGDESFDEWLTRVATELDLTDAALRRLVELTRAAAVEVSSLEDVDDRDIGSDDVMSEPNGIGELGADSIEPDFLRELLASMSNLSDAVPPQIEGRVTFTTMHGAKGLTADVCIVLQAEDEVIPGEVAGAELEELRRLLYVSLTRARKLLIIGACFERLGAQRFVGDRLIEGRTVTSFLVDYGLAATPVRDLIRRAQDGL